MAGYTPLTLDSEGAAAAAVVSTRLSMRSVPAPICSTSRGWKRSCLQLAVCCTLASQVASMGSAQHLPGQRCLLPQATMLHPARPNATGVHRAQDDRAGRDAPPAAGGCCSTAALATVHPCVAFDPFCCVHVGLGVAQMVGRAQLHLTFRAHHTLNPWPNKKRSMLLLAVGCSPRT